MAVGLDGLTLNRLMPLVESGQLPTFARLVAEGAVGTLESVGNTMTGPAWASFATGVLPAAHGVLHDYHHLSDAYTVRQTTGADVRRPGFWSLASDAGRESIVLNVPHTYPAPQLGGVLLAGIDAPSESAPGFCHPAGAYRELKRATGDYLIDSGGHAYLEAAKGHHDQPAVDAAVAAVTRETEGRTRAVEYLAGRREWDLMVVVYSLPDIWQHYFWHTLNDSPSEPGAGLVDYGYTQMDQHLARVVALLPDDGLLVLFSDHGFGPATGCRKHLNDWLETGGWLAYRGGGRQRAMRSAFHALLGFARRYSSYNARQRLLSVWPALQKAVDSRLNIGDIDWSRTRAYAALDHRELWLNVCGRQPGGIVPPDDTNDMLRQLAAELLDWHDRDTGRPFVLQVSEQPYSECDDNSIIAPDLAIEWDSSVEANDAHPTMSGDHTMDGALVVWGEGVEAGTIDDAKLTGIAPFVLQQLGVEVPRWMARPVAVDISDDNKEHS